MTMMSPQSYNEGVIIVYITPSTASIGLSSSTALCSTVFGGEIGFYFTNISLSYVGQCGSVIAGQDIDFLDDYGV